MENRTNQIMSLPSGREYFINRQILYKGKTYFVTTMVSDEPDTDGSKKPSNEIVIFEQFTEDGKTKVAPVKDPDVIKIIAENL